MRLSRILARAVRDAIFPHRSDLAAELRRYKGNNDNILTALAEAGVPVPQEDDGVLRSYWMVRDVIEERDKARDMAQAADYRADMSDARFKESLDDFARVSCRACRGAVPETGCVHCDHSGLEPIEAMDIEDIELGAHGVYFPTSDDGTRLATWRELCGLVLTYDEKLKAAKPEPVTRPRPEVPTERRRAILRAVHRYQSVQAVAQPMTAKEIAERSDDRYNPDGLTAATITRLISDLAADGYLAHDGKRPRSYRLTDKGVADIETPTVDVEALDVDGVGRRALRNCDSCKHDEGDRCTAMNVHIYKWSNKNTGESGRPKPGADNCPGYEARS